MKEQDVAAVSSRMIDTTSNRTKGMSASQSHMGEEVEGEDEESYLSGSEHDVYGGERDDDDMEEDEVDNRDFDLTEQLGITPAVPEYLKPLILTSE